MAGQASAGGIRGSVAEISVATYFGEDADWGGVRGRRTRALSNACDEPCTLPFSNLRNGDAETKAPLG